MAGMFIVRHFLQKGRIFMMEHLRYLTDFYDEKIARIHTIGAPLNFVFITDQHNRLNAWASGEAAGHYELAVNAIDSIQYILDRCPEISFVVSGGDIGNDYHPDPVAVRRSHKEVMDALYRLSVPVHCCIGNHDDGIGNAIDHGWDTCAAAILPDEMHALCMKNNPTEENYYYVDDAVHAYRYVFLNTSDKPYYKDENGQYPFGWRNEISNKQAVWLEKEALCTDRHILIFSHAPLHNAGIFGTENPPQGIKPYDDLLNGPRVYYAVKTCRRVAAMFAGHVHYDNLLYDDGILSATTLCSFAQKWSPNCPDRTYGTPDETAFDVVSIKDSTIFFTRFGAGCDRTGLLYLQR